MVVSAATAALVGTGGLLDLGEEALAEAWELGSAMTLDEGVELALAVG